MQQPLTDLDQAAVKSWINTSTTATSRWVAMGPVLYCNNVPSAVVMMTANGRVVLASNECAADLCDIVDEQALFFTTAKETLKKVADVFTSGSTIRNAGVHMVALDSQVGMVMNAIDTIKTAKCPLPFRLAEADLIDGSWKKALMPIIAFRDYIGFAGYHHIAILPRDNDHEFVGSAIQLYSVVSSERESGVLFLVRDEKDAVALRLKDVLVYKFRNEDIASTPSNSV